MHVVATAGHVDHGKSTLVLALTGTDPDRLAEEKRRGLTIDLGFATTTLASGRDVAFVDVPGHVRFVANMLAGVAALDPEGAAACLFVVAATEGWKPQSEEHLRILELLGVGAGVVALTKVGLADDDQITLARMDLEDHLAGTFLESAEVVEVDVPAGRGLDDLRAALDRLVAVLPPVLDSARPRLWVDRRFAAKGVGTIVTGTLLGGEMAVGDDLLLLPDNHPHERAVRVRGLQSHGSTRRSVTPGRRVAVNLVGIGQAEVQRGDALVQPGQWHATATVDASLTVLASLDHDVSHRGAYVVHLGSGAWPARLRVLGGAGPLAPGSSGAVRLHLGPSGPLSGKQGVALPLLPGDRFVLRESGRGETVGGGEVLDVEPVLRAALARPDRSAERVLAERGFVEAKHFERLTGQRRVPQVGRWLASPTALEAASAAVAAAVDGAAPLGLDVATLDERSRAVLAGLSDVVVIDGRARRADQGDPLRRHPWLVALEADPFSPPPPGPDVDRADVRELVRSGRVIERDGAYFAADAVVAAARSVAELLASTPAGVTVAQVRDALGSSRKHLLPLLGILDAAAFTRRRGDVRVAGPRLPAPR